MMILVAMLITTCLSPASDELLQELSARTSKVAAEQCGFKLKKIEAFAVNRREGEKQVIRISQEELNSYLALDLSQKYHPSVKRLVISFENERLHGIALLDFDLIGSLSEGLLPKIVNMLLTGKHIVAARGQVQSSNGMAAFHLEQAWLDGNTLPSLIIEEIIATVCKKQRPPFNPFQPSEMPYRIQSIELRKGFVTIYQ